MYSIFSISLFFETLLIANHVVCSHADSFTHLSLVSFLTLVTKLSCNIISLYTTVETFQTITNTDRRYLNTAIRKVQKWRRSLNSDYEQLLMQRASHVHHLTHSDIKACSLVCCSYDNDVSLKHSPKSFSTVCLKATVRPWVTKEGKY